MPEKNTSQQIEVSPTTGTETFHIAGLVVHKTFNPRIIPVLEELRDNGMKCVYRSEVSIAPDDRFLFVLSDRPFSSDEQRHEADSILVDLLNFESPEPIHFTSEGTHGVFVVIDFVRV